MKSDWDPDSSKVQCDQVAAYDEMRRRCPVAYSEARGWSLFRHADVMRVLHDPESFSNHVSQHLSVPNGMDPPEHTVYRKVIEPYFNPERIKSFEPTCRRIAADLIGNVVSKGNDVELISEVASHFAVQIQCAFLGWPVSLHDTLIDWNVKHHDATRKIDRKRLSELARTFETIVDGLIKHRIASSAGPHEDLTASLLHETVDGRRLSNEEITSILRNWTVGEVGTISAAIGILVHQLADDQNLQQQMRCEATLLPTAIDEILRVHNPLVNNRRTTTCPVQIGARQIEANERLSLNWISANRDETVFAEPTTVRLDRNPDKNLLYGAGLHVCPGAPLARMELQVFMEKLLELTTGIDFQPDVAPVLAAYPASGYALLPIHVSSESPSDQASLKNTIRTGVR
ncbi:Putative cytochrome P450 124 [Stieleria maiorica]|uniref:Cytochrome P450 124 n=1 Tax=Stieleria maiorica TaxID=2795974 RepID=A0A5B9M979_9BACT|nr:Putative cytochrome P450 124 [Stieleria maiorica]